MTPQQFRQFADLLAEPALMIDSNGVILAANRVCGSRQFQTPARELCGRRLQELVRSDEDQIGNYLCDCARRRDVVLGSLTFTGAHDEPVRFRCEGGAICPRSGTDSARIMIRLFPREVANNAFEVVNMRLTQLERQRFENVLRNSEQTLRTIFEQAAVGVALIDTNSGRPVRINQRFCDLIGISVDEMTGTRLQQMTHPDDLQAYLENMARLVAGEIRDFTLEQRYFHKDGSPVWINMTVSATWQSGTVPVHHIAVVEDIGTRKQAEAQRDQHAEELKRANNELDQFAYVASHDLKAPLRAIDSLAKWVVEDAEDQLPEACREHLGKMQQRVQRMDTLLSDLLHYSRAGRLHYDPEVLNTGQLIGEITELIAPPDGWSITVADDMPALETARPPLEQVFMNLITNAIKHHDRSNGHIEISVRELDHFFEFAVADDGPGIDPKFHERIFGMFQTLVSRDKVEGSGMGLAVIKKVVASYGGTVSVESAVGRGTTFRFTWPKAQTTQRETPRTEKMSLTRSSETKKELVHVE